MQTTLLICTKTGRIDPGKAGLVLGNGRVAKKPLARKNRQLISASLAILVIGTAIGFRRAFCVAFAAVIFGICLFEYFVHPISWFNTFQLNLISYFTAGSCYYIFRDKIIYNPIIASVAAVILFFGLFSFRAHELVFVIAGTYLLFFFAFAKVPLLANFGRLPDVSYGLYLYGWPIEKLIIWWFPGISPWAVFFLAAAVAIGAGWTSWYVIEKRFIEPRRNVTASTLAVVDPFETQESTRD